MTQVPPLPSERPAPSDDRGFALLIVAITLAALSLMIGSILYMTRHHAQELAASISMLKLRSAMDGATATAAAELSFSGPVSAQSETTSIGGVSVHIAVRPESAKFNLNKSDPALLVALLNASGVSPAFAQRVADEIVDWRDADSEPHASGAEAADYLAAGRSYVPTNRPFESVAELSLLLDGSDDLVTCLRPDVTVFGDSDGVIAQNASSRLRQALEHSTLHIQQSAIGAGARPAIVAGDVFEIDERASDSGIATSRQVILRVTGDPRGPIRLLFQSPLIPSEAEALKACARLERSRAH
jgi:general secretion pathway protein K